jgi:hypothetical protein
VNVRHPSFSRSASKFHISDEDSVLDRKQEGTLYLQQCQTQCRMTIRLSELVNEWLLQAERANQLRVDDWFDNKRNNLSMTKHHLQQEHMGNNNQCDGASVVDEFAEYLAWKRLQRSSP